MDISLIKSVAVSAFGRSSFIVKKYAPEILLGTGIVGGISAAVLACKATYKVDGVRYLLVAHLDDFEQARKNAPEDYSEEDLKKDTATAYAEMVIGLAKLYGPAVGLGVVSVCLILASHGIMTQRQAALMAAYKLMDEAYAKYRKNVQEKYGQETEEKLHLGLQDETKKKKKDGPDVSTSSITDPLELSPYARWFNRHTSCQFKNDNLSNNFFLRTVETEFNMRLQAYGHVFLNEVYDALGLERSKEGAIVGWVKNAIGGDNIVSFTMYAPTLTKEEIESGEQAKQVLLDFNVDGVMWDLI